MKTECLNRTFMELKLTSKLNEAQIWSTSQSYLYGIEIELSFLDQFVTLARLNRTFMELKYMRSQRRGCGR